MALGKMLASTKCAKEEPSLFDNSVMSNKLAIRTKVRMSDPHVAVCPNALREVPTIFVSRSFFDVVTAAAVCIVIAFVGHDLIASRVFFSVLVVALLVIFNIASCDVTPEQATSTACGITDGFYKFNFRHGSLLF